MENRRKFRLADVILSVICVVFVAEAAAPVASIGNSQYFWWLFMIAAFLLPYVAPVVAVTFVWRIMLNPEFGIVNHFGQQVLDTLLAHHYS